MIKSSDISKRAAKALQGLLKHTGQSFRTEGAPKLYYLINLQTKVNNGSIKIKPTPFINQYRANILNASLKEVLRIAIIAGNVANKSKKQLQELWASMEECVALLTGVLEKSSPSDSERLAMKCIKQQQTIRIIQKKQITHEK